MGTIKSIKPKNLDMEKQNGKSTSRKQLLITIVIAIILIAGIWIWKAVQIGNVEKKARSERQALIEAATKQIVQAHATHLNLLAKPYVWAVRADMMRNNLNQINLFSNDLVKEENFQRIVIANDKGIIVSSTNKKDEGEPFSSVGKDAGLTNNNTTVENMHDSLLIMTTPIMGFNTRLGTLLIKYTIPPPQF